MYKAQKLFVCLYLCAFGALSQSNNINEILKTVEQNNKELKAYRLFVESKKILNKTTNNLPDPEASVYYLKSSSNTNPQDYTEFEISQSFDFPTVYGARKKWNNLKAEELEYRYKQLRQNVLFKAELLLIKLIKTQKQKAIYQQRFINSKKVYEQTKELFQKEEINVLDLNKAKVTYLKHQFNVQKAQTELNSLKKQLGDYNGNLPLDIGKIDYSEVAIFTDFESLWNEKKEIDVAISKLKSIELSSFQQLKVEKNKILPNLTLGYNSQGVSGNRVSGILGGFSIPLWNNKNKVKAAKANYEYQKANTIAKTSIAKSNYQKLFSNYSLLYDNYNVYRTTVEELNSEKLLLKAYELGEYSYMQYYLELDFYEKAVDQMHAMEFDLQQLKAELLKHKL